MYSSDRDFVVVLLLFFFFYNRTVIHSLTNLVCSPAGTDVESPREVCRGLSWCYQYGHAFVTGLQR